MVFILVDFSKGPPVRLDEFVSEIKTLQKFWPKVILQVKNKCFNTNVSNVIIEFLFGDLTDYLRAFKCSMQPYVNFYSKEQVQGLKVDDIIDHK